MDEQPQPQQPETPPSEEKPPKDRRPPLTPLQQRKRCLTEGVIVLLVCLWFMYDGWFNPEIHSKSFNKLGTIILGWWFLYDMYMVVKYHRAAKAGNAAGSLPPPSSPP
ncbi:MAG: hypothetical protein EXS18_06015 [Verrucomicrobiae bacterium]|nr:hypothetical protein [Verrucomicrobiae bacterium]